MSGTQLEKQERARRAAAVKAERKALAGLSRTLKLRLYPLPAQAAKINRTIGVTRFVWNTIWLPMVEKAEAARRDHAKQNGETKDAWKAAWKLFPDPTDTDLNRARILAHAADGPFPWIAEALLTPLTRAAINFTDAVKASRGRTRTGAQRKVRAGRVQPRARRDDSRQGLEWQIQGKAPLGGRPLAALVDTAAKSIAVPGVGAIRFEDRCRLLARYLEAGVEACELTVKREGEQFYACIAIRGLQPPPAHATPDTAIGIDMGVANPLATSDGEFVTHHQGHDIKVRLARLERRKLRVKRQYARKLHAAAERAGAVTATGAFKKGVRIETSNRMRRLLERQNKIDRQIVGYRADWQRKRALEIARNSEIIVVEALTIKNMTASAAGTMEAPGRNVRAKAALNRSLLARGFGSMRSRLKSKSEELGGRVIEVDPAYTSQTCPACGHTSRDNRKTQAEFACVACGHTQHADIVGATNILKRGLSAGAPPAAGRGGLATGPQPSGGGAERAGDPSNKSSREPEASSKNAAGSRAAKPHNARNELEHRPDATHEDQHRREQLQKRGSRDGPD